MIHRRINYVDPPKYSYGGSILSGAGSGAAMGSSIMPGWGTLIGAVAGGAMGYFKENKLQNAQDEQKRKEEELIAKQQLFLNKQADRQILSQFPTYGVNQSFFKFGGEIDEPIRDNTNVINSVQKDYINNMINNYGKPLKKRYDFKGNFLSTLTPSNSAVIRDELFDYWRGQPIKNSNLSYSKYRPTDETDPKSIYISWNDPEFKRQLVQYYKENYKGETLRPHYTYQSKETGERFNKFMSLGNFKVSGGKDDKGEFIQYYDVFDYNKGTPKLNKSEILGAGKPFEIYDRIYLKEFEKENKKALGGYTTPQYEAEGNEVIEHSANPLKKPKTLGGKLEKLSNTTSKIKGKSHEEGGIPMSGGDRIFSDKLPAPLQLLKLSKKL